MELFFLLLYNDSKHNENAKKYFPFYGTVDIFPL